MKIEHIEAGETLNLTIEAHISFKESADVDKDELIQAISDFASKWIKEMYLCKK